ncbi:MAG TPA: hypothetical protein VI636_05445 [Candidatus Angelobacter sp.]
MSGPTGSTIKFHSFSIAGSNIYWSQLFALAIALAALAIQFFVSPEALIQALACCVVIGCVVAIARFDFLAHLGERFAAALKRRKERARQRGKFSRWVIRPAYAGCDGVTRATQRLSDPFVRTGFRITLWLIVGSIVTCIAVYITLIVAVMVFALLVMWFVLWAMSDHSGPNKPLPKLARAGTRFGFEHKQGKPHLVQRGLLDKDIGELKRRNYRTQEITHIFGPNLRVVENLTALGAQDPHRPYRVETPDGQHVGDLVKQVLGDDLKFEPSEEAETE